MRIPSKNASSAYVQDMKNTLKIPKLGH